MKHLLPRADHANKTGKGEREQQAEGFRPEGLQLRERYHGPTLVAIAMGTNLKPCC